MGTEPYVVVCLDSFSYEETPYSLHDSWDEAVEASIVRQKTACQISGDQCRPMLLSEAARVCQMHPDDVRAFVALGW